MLGTAINNDDRTVFKDMPVVHGFKTNPCDIRAAVALCEEIEFAGRKWKVEEVDQQREIVVFTSGSTRRVYSRGDISINFKLIDDVLWSKQYINKGFPSLEKEYWSPAKVRLKKH